MSPDQNPAGSFEGEASGSTEKLCPIVAIGASAGGLDALKDMFAHLPNDTGMAFVVIQHLDPDRPSMLASLLAGATPMPVVQVVDGMQTEPDHVYVIPPDADLSIHSRRLTLVPRDKSGKLHLPIDAFFRALAIDLSGQAIGVVLSGSASDGTDGLREIKAAGGITLAQEPDSAQFRSMPESAIAAGVVDFRAVPEAIAGELFRLGQHPYLTRIEPPEAGAEKAPRSDEDSLTLILAAMRKNARLEFSGYKRPTLMRRIARRMALQRFDSLHDYAKSLRGDARECHALSEDILIHVTRFFRDASAFEALKEQVFPKLLERDDDDAAVRVWVPGCATGEEVYSLAICLIEFFAEHHRTPAIKIFGSDLSERAIDAARAGLYAAADLEPVGPERLERYFERSEGGYRVGKQVRDLCLFVRHDLAKDPPFARIDLISCRNVLIYFDVGLQRRILPLFHYCLGNPGYLFLGSSEGIREFEALFEPFDRANRIFRKKGESPRIVYPLALGKDVGPKRPTAQSSQRPQFARDAQRQADHILLARYAPPGVLLNERFEVVQFRGRTGEFLEAPPGQPQMNVLRMAREGLVVPLREALERAQSESNTVRRQAVEITEGAQTSYVNIEVVPLAGITAPAERFFLVVFERAARFESTEDGPPPPDLQGASAPVRGHALEELSRLRAELAATSEHLQAVTGEHQDTAEELSAANEEHLAANEELQSANEELQSAQEELQSTNEELSTLNDELQDKNQQLDLVATDLVNVLESVKIPVIMVDHDLRIRRFTPTAREVSSLLPGDVGRSIDDVKLKVKVDDLADRIRDTIESVTPKQFEVQGVDGRWFRLHIRPYRTADNRLDGAVLSFLDVDVLTRAVAEAERVRDYAQGIVATVPIALAVVDATQRIISANAPFSRLFAGQANAAEHGALFEVAAGALDLPALREATRLSLDHGTAFQNLEIRCAIPTIGERDIVVAGCPIRSFGDDLTLLLVLDDITERRQLEESEKQSRIEAQQANHAKDLFLATLSHELRTPLSTILMSAQLLRKTGSEDSRIQRASAAIERAVGTQAKLIDDLLDISRIVSGKLMLELQAVDIATVVRDAVDVARVSADAKGIVIELFIRRHLRSVHGDPTRLQQMVANLLNNAIKFSPMNRNVFVDLDEVDAKAQITVRDTGLGLSAEMIPRLFNRFIQAESSMTRAYGGLGLGLALVKHIATVHGGEVSVESPGEGKGSTFTVTLPLAADPWMNASPDRGNVARSISGMRVLLIEDDDDTREASVALLEAQGAKVVAAGSVAAGIAALQTFTPQAIFCDIAMPGVDGYEFIRRLRSGKAARSTPAAALTALAGEEDRRRALEAGFQMHLAKPISSEGLAIAVATLADWPVDH